MVSHHAPRDVLKGDREGSEALWRVRGGRKGCARGQSVADVSACLREALKLKTGFRLKLFSAGAGTESQLDCFQSHA